MNIGELAKFRGGVSADTISELTSASGVTIDGVLLKDASITASGTGANTFGGLITCGGTARSDVALSTTVSAKFRSGNAAYTDNVTAASGTVSHGTINSFDNPAIAATNGSVTYTNASTLYIDGAPTAGSNVAITNPYAIYINSGSCFFSDLRAVNEAFNSNTFQNRLILSDNFSSAIVGVYAFSRLDQNNFNATTSITTTGGAVRAVYGLTQITGASGTVTSATCFAADFQNTGAGTVTNGIGYYCDDANNSGTLTNQFGYYCEAQTTGATNYAFYANNAASGTARYNFYAAGTAPNVFNGAITTPRTTLTASATGSGAITVINNYHAVSGAGGAASTITTINGGIDGMMVVLKAVSDTVDISFATGGNILLDGGATFTCDTLNDTITLIYDASLSKWLEIGRCNNS